jgi:hypothetical protein
MSARWEQSGWVGGWVIWWGRKATVRFQARAKCEEDRAALVCYNCSQAAVLEAFWWFSSNTRHLMVLLVNLQPGG